jgi:potassium-dependent mechanosensitive channel
MNSRLDIHLFDLAGTPITVVTLVVIGLVLVATILISRLLQSGTAEALRVRGVKEEGTIAVTCRLVHYSILTVGLVVGLQLVGINLGTLLAAGALVALGIGFALQNVTQNFVSGVILLVERSIKPNDILEVEGQIIRVVKMGIRATVGRTLEDQEVIIPNSMLVQSPVKNFTLRDSLYRLRAPVGVLYSSDMALVRSTLEETARKLTWRAADVPPRVLLRTFGDSSVIFEVSVWVDDPWRAQSRLSELNEAIWWALKKAGITIAFPQLDVHFDRSVTESLQGLAGSAGRRQ